MAEQINEYIYLELKYMEQLDRQMQTQESILLLADLGVVIGVMALMVLAQLLIDRASVYRSTRWWRTRAVCPKVISVLLWKTAGLTRSPYSMTVSTAW